MKRRHLRSYCLLLAFLLTARTSFAQTISAQAIIQQVLLTHIGPNGLPSDFVIQGQVIDRLGTRSLRMQVKGKNQIRYEQTQGTKTDIAIYNAGMAWTGPAGSLKPLMEFAALRR